MIGMAQDPVKMAPVVNRVTELPLTWPAPLFRVMVPPAEPPVTDETVTKLAETFAERPLSAKLGIPFASESGRRLEPPIPTRPRSANWLPDTLPSRTDRG